MNGHSPGNGSSEPFTTHVDASFISQFGGSPSKGPVLVSTSGVEAVLTSNDPRKTKQLLRANNWPPTHEVRRNLWLKLCHVRHKDNSDIYREVVKDVFGDAEHQHDVTMPSFVDPSNMYHYHLKEHGVHVVKRIVCIIAHTNPDITFAPGIFAMCSLFLHYMEEQDAYNCMYSMLRCQETYLCQTKIAFESSRYILRDLAKKYAKPFCTYISKHGMVVEGILENWHWWIFLDLPFAHVVRVVDCFLYEGPKVLYRVALALINAFYKHNLKNLSTNTLDIETSIRQFCEDIPIPVDRLLKMAFGLRGLSRKTLRKLQLKNELFVRSLQHAAVEPTMHKSVSYDSLNLVVSTSFTAPPTSAILDDTQVSRVRSRSFGFQPFTNIRSRILTNPDWQVIWQWLPMRITLYTPHLLFNTAEHGTSLHTFYTHIEGHEPTLIIVKTSTNEVFGVYCSVDWAERLHNVRTMSYFGTGETFLFTMLPKRKRYQWVGHGKEGKVTNSEHLFLSGDNSKLAIGGGNGNAFIVDEDMYKGSSTRCDTFDNEPLVPSKDFLVNSIEVYGFQ